MSPEFPEFPGVPGIPRKTVFDAASQVTQVKVAVGVTGEEAAEVTASYTNNGQLATVTDGEGNKTTYEHDGHDRLAKTFYPSPTTDGLSSTTDYEQLALDAAGNVTSRRARDGQAIAFSYDALDRLTFVDRPNAAYWETDDSFGYDLLGRLTSTSDQNGHSIMFGHDALGRATSQADNWYGTTFAEFDLAGRRTRLNHSLGQADERFDYLVTGEMSAVRSNAGFVLATIGYDALGRRAGLSRFNGTSTSYGYDAAGRLAALGHDFAGTADDVTFSYAYNPAGQITSRTANNDAYSFTALADRNVADSHDGLNQVTASGSTAVAHDGRGNTTLIGSAAYGYTVDNRLATTAAGNYAYDQLGRMMHASGPALDFLYDIGTGALLGEKAAFGGPVQRTYVLGPDVDERLMQYSPATGAIDHLHADERGSIVAVSDGSGNVTAINKYDEYGQPQGGGITGRFGYTGQTWLPELGLWYYKARVYNPDADRGGTRFMQTDPIGYGDGMNLYGYVKGDPVNYVDPSGSRTCTSGRPVDPATRRPTGGWRTDCSDARPPCRFGAICLVGDALNLDFLWNDRPTLGQSLAAGGGGAPQKTSCSVGSVGEIRRNLPNKSALNQIKDGLSSYIQGLGGTTALAARVGLLGSPAQQQATSAHQQLAQVGGQIASHPDQTITAVTAVASKYPFQLGSRLASGGAISVLATPYGGTAASLLSGYGSAFKAAHQHPNAVAVAAIVGEDCQ